MGEGRGGRTFLDGEAVELRRGVRSSEKERARNLCGCWLTSGEFGGSGLAGEGGLEKKGFTAVVQGGSDLVSTSGDIRLGYIAVW